MDDVIQHSVTKGDYIPVKNGWGSMRVSWSGGSAVPVLEDLPDYWSRDRDRVLSAAYRKNGLWASAVRIATARFATAGFELDHDVALRVKRAREILGREWTETKSKLATAFVTTDNGGFIEIVRATKAYGSRVLGLVPLSSQRCYRTGDPSVPVIYLGRDGRNHELRAHQVAEFADAPDDDYDGVGLCATSRAYTHIQRDQVVKQYLLEKTSGRRPLALDLITGISGQNIKDALGDAQMQADSAMYSQYMGVATLANPNQIPIGHVRLDYASLPDGFTEKEHNEETQILYAAALGIDPSDLNPRLIGNRALGAGSQAQTLDDKVNSKGMASLFVAVQEFLLDTERWRPLPGSVTFAWSESDLRDQKQKAEIAKLRADTRSAQIASGEISADQSRQMAVDAGDVPAEFVARDTTDNDTLTDQDKAQVAAQQQPDTVAAGGSSTGDNPAPPPTGRAALAQAIKELSVIAEKRMPAGATVLAQYEPPADAPNTESAARYWRAVTKAFDEIGSAWTAAADPPQAEGETKRSIGYTIANRNTHLVRLALHAGNSSRPEVAIRAVLFGRKGFGPKRAKVLRFRVGSKTVYARKVRGAAAQDWLSESLRMIAPQIKAAQKSLGALRTDLIAVSDIAGARRYNVAPPAPSDRAIARARRGGK